jgi:hypothetical protein
MVAFVVVVLPWLATVWPLFSDKPLVQAIADRYGWQQMPSIAIIAGGVVSAAAFAMLVFITVQSLRPKPLTEVATELGKGIWLRSRVISGDAQHVNEFAREEHVWRTNAVTVVSNHVNVGKGHWVGNGVNNLEAATESVKVQYPHLGAQRAEIVARIDRIVERLGSVVTDMESRAN